MAVWSIIPLSSLSYTLRLDAEYYQPIYLENIGFLINCCQYPVLTFNELLLSMSGGATPLGAEYLDIGVPFLRVQNIMPGYLDMNDVVYISIQTHNTELVRSQLKSGDVLLTITGVSYGKAAYVPSGFGEANINQHSVRMAFKPKVLSEYVAIFLNCKFGKLQSDMKVTGVTRPALDYGEIRSILIPILPLPLQEEIRHLVQASEIERKQSKSLYAEAEALLLRELHLDTLDLSHQLTYERNFSEVLEPKRWDAQFYQPKYDRLVDHITRIAPVEQIGSWNKVLKGRSPGAYTEEGVPVLRAGDLVNIDEMSEWLHTPPGPHLFYLKPGDVCISSIGFGSIGKVQVFDKTETCATVSEVTVIRQKRVNPYYLQVYLQSPFGQMFLEKYITGATGQLHLYPRDVEKIDVPVLPSTIQQQCEELINRAKQAREDAKQLLEAAKRRVEQLIESGAR